jgi:tetratricopeptide (TPR) repeat protein
MAFTNDELERLRPRLFEDPNTGERVLVYVRDYVVHDIVTTNARHEDSRPVYFAVTIPRENMERYFAKLQMEGLAYRLTETDSLDGLPTTDPRRLLENVFGVYYLDALTDGDTEQRQARFAEKAGWAGDSPQAKLIGGASPQNAIDYLALMDEVGIPRTDVYRNLNTVHLLGNYPAALSRAGYEFIVEAENVAYEDTATYDGLLNDALAAFEMALRFDPYNEQSVSIYPLILVEKGRTDDALDYLDRVRGYVEPVLWQRAAAETGIALVRVQRPRQAVNWLNDQIAREPADKFFYEALFRIFQYLERATEAQDVMERWERQSGERDPAMAEIVEQMRARAMQREQQRIEDAVQGGNR